MKLQKATRILLACLLLSLRGAAQAHGNPSTQTPPAASFPAPTDPTVVGNGDAAEHRMMEEMAKKANLARQAAIKSDTEKLLTLAEELKTSVDKSSANVLSLDVIKKAEEIEKLAHSVKDKMKGPS